MSKTTWSSNPIVRTISLRIFCSSSSRSSPSREATCGHGARHALPAIGTSVPVREKFKFE
eukprot:scaffold85740_cov66-Phaeocystis_antarctica.AAC.16